ERRHRIEAHVAEELHPELLLDRRRNDDLEPGRAQRVLDAGSTRRVLAAGLADDQLARHVVADEPGLRRGSGEVDYAADDALGGHRPREMPARIERFQPLAAITKRQAVEEPPRYSVHRRQDRCARTDQRADGLCDICKALGLYRDE